MRSACVAALLVFAGPAVARAAPAPAGAEGKPRLKLHPRLQKSIDAGVKYLRKQQGKDGSWEAGALATTFPGGYTSLALLALLECGVAPRDPAVQKGLAHLRKVKPSQTYVVALQTLVFARAGQPADRERIQRNVDWLLESRKPDGWSYGGRGRGGSADNSNTRFALLALHEAIGAGVKVDRKALEEVRELYIKSQDDGGWGYVPQRGRPTMTMTAGCLSSLLIAGMHLDAGKVRLRKDGSTEDCGKYPDEESVPRALAWLGDHFPAALTERDAAEHLGSVYYCLHALERAGRLTGQRYFGRHDWYEAGCRFLVATQKANGSWDIMPGRPQLEQSDLVRTAFALLFLAHGRAPVLVAKLAYGGRDYGGWNNKRNDARHLVDFAGRELFGGAPVGWQVFGVGGKGAGGKTARQLADELSRTPVLYFNGHDRVPRGKVEAVLKRYVSRGGLVLAEACCGDKRFDREFRALMKRLFPKSPLRPLPATHPIWKAGKFAVPPRAFPLEGIEKDGRTVVIYSPAPLAGYWEANDHARGRGQLAFRLGANVVRYATGGGLPPPRGRKLTLDKKDRD
jgi:hypothetical protein